MIDEGRRRVLRLAVLAVASLGGGAAVLASRLRDEDATGGAPSPPEAAGSTSTTPSPSTSSSSPRPRPATLDDSTSPTGARASAAAGGVSMLCRDAWHARPPSREVPPHTIAGLMVHHTAVALADNRQAPARVRGHQRFHQSKGFADIAYHVVVDGNGNVYEGRDQSRPGETFTDYDPTGWFLVVCEGNFDEQDFPPAQRRAVAGVLAWASRRYGVPPEALASHRQHAHTRCPGEAVHSLVVDGTLARLVRERLDAGVDLALVCGPAADARVAAIEAGTA